MSISQLLTSTARWLRFVGIPLRKAILVHKSARWSLRPYLTSAQGTLSGTQRSWSSSPSPLTLLHSTQVKPETVRTIPRNMSSNTRRLSCSRYIRLMTMGTLGCIFSLKRCPCSSHFYIPSVQCIVYPLIYIIDRLVHRNHASAVPRPISMGHLMLGMQISVTSRKDTHNSKYCTQRCHHKLGTYVMDKIFSRVD